jgi:hypothetical protein
MDLQSRRPNPDICRTSYFTDKFWICHADHFIQILACPFVFEFGYRYYCRHPERRTFSSLLTKERQHNELSL